MLVRIKRDRLRMGGRLSVSAKPNFMSFQAAFSKFFFSIRINSFGQSHMTKAENNLKTLE